MSVPASVRSWRLPSLLGVAFLLLAACGGGGGGGVPVIEEPKPDPALGLQAFVPEYEDDVKRFSLGFGSSQLSDSASWDSTMPAVGNQGQQGSCVGWAIGYYLKTSWEVREEGWAPDTAAHNFSPAWIYNQINGGVDLGSLPNDALSLLTNSGAATFATMLYDPTNHTSQPGAPAVTEATRFKNAGRRVFAEYDVDDLKEYLSSTGPLVFGIDVFSNFFNPGAVYTGVSGAASGGHAICCVGYDDSVAGGSFHLLNSWGTEWADDGYVWVPYDVMGTIFRLAVGMVDGPNTSVGGGAPGPLPAPNGLVASQSESDFFVWTLWSSVPGAVGYVVQRQEIDGAWRTIAQPPADTWYHYDFGVTPGTSYNYRVAAVNGSGTVGSWAQTRGRTAAGVPVLPITLSASSPVTGTSYPDRIHLSWPQLAGDHWYVIARADNEEGLITGQYFVLDTLWNAGAIDDLVQPGSAFVYKVFAVDSTGDRLAGESNDAWGSTSGSLGGQDIGILDAWGATVVTRGALAPCDITIFNYSLAASPNQRVSAGIEYYFTDGSFGYLWTWNNARTLPIFDDTTATVLPSYSDALWFFDAVAPEYLLYSTPGGGDSFAHWWYFYVDPLDAAGSSILEDVYPYDNAFYTYDDLFVQ